MIFFIHKMIILFYKSRRFRTSTGWKSANKKRAMTTDGFVKYIPLSDETAKWELAVTNCGWTHVPPDSPYPPGEHPDAYSIHANTGRILEEEQIVYITRGKGTFWSEDTGSLNIQAGNIFLLFSSIRHSYQPNPTTGWDEHWIGFTGDYAKRLMSRFFSSRKPVLSIGNHPDLLNLFIDISTLAGRETFGYRPIVAAKTLEIMARLNALAKQSGVRSDEKEKIVRDTCCHILEAINTPIDFKKYAEGVGISYSSFRRIFKEHTGLPPNQYLLEMRIQKAKGLLVNTDLKLQPIGEACGFDNVNYFSRLFKDRTGCPPRQYRKSIR